ncbi:MAG: exopolysaccharide biosynthesis polyprenyl glycosylphosphotransferase [Candidatus Omnitrophota bacterium]
MNLAIINNRRTNSFAFIILKRTLDIILSVLALVSLSPFLLLVCLLVKISSPGPIIYKQKRCGLNNKIFFIYKFRTMPSGIEKDSGPVWGDEADCRSTKLGLYLRISHIDELPQLINVLRGEMSLVGPRPERPYFANQFKKDIPDYELRHMVKPGITGWAQINGYRGNTSIAKRTEYDLYYIHNWSLLFDLKIIFNTPASNDLKTLFSRHHSSNPLFNLSSGVFYLKENSRS